MVTGIMTAIYLTNGVHAMLAATDTLELNREGTLSFVMLLGVIDNCHESVAVLSLADLTFIRGNKSSSLYFGDFIGSKIVDIIFEDDRQSFLERVTQLEEEGKKFGTTEKKEREAGSPSPLDEESPLLSGSSTPTSLEYRVYDEHNDLIWVESTFLLHEDDSSHIPTVMLLTRDVTVKRTKAEQVRQENTTKLQYITCCAHDLKTPLQSFSSALDLLLTSGLSPDQKDIWDQAEISLSLMNLTIAQTKQSAHGALCFSIACVCAIVLTTQFVLRVSS